MPIPEDLLYHWEQTKSGWTFLAFIIVAFVVAFAAATIFTTTTLTTLGNLAGMGSVMPTTAFGMAALEAGAYAVGNLIMNNGGALTDIQDGYYGKISSDGSFSPPEASNEHQAGLNNAVKDRQITRDITAGLTGVVQLEQGTAPHPGDYTEFNSIRYSLENGAPLQQGLDNNLLR